MNMVQEVPNKVLDLLKEVKFKNSIKVKDIYIYLLFIAHLYIYIYTYIYIYLAMNKLFRVFIYPCLTYFT